jgi:alkylation response protein AidB-like acyl-CoA dehydrogenase
MTPSLLTLQHTVRAFVTEHLIPLEVEVELADGFLAPERKAALKEKVRALGVYSSSLPRSLGGTERSWLEQVIINEEIGKATNALGWLVWSPAIVLRHATPDQTARFVRPAAEGRLDICYAVTEAGAGSDAGTLATTAARDADGWLINGEKWHVTSAYPEGVAVVQCNTGAAGDSNTLFFVPLNAPGVTFAEHPRYMHHLIDPHARLTFENVRVPHANVLGAVGNGLAISKEWFLHERVLIAARCVGAAWRLLDEASRFAQERVQFGAPIAEYQFIQGMLADSLVELYAARLMTHAAARAADEARTEEDYKIVHAKASMTKLYASEMVGRVADRAVQVFGGRGYMRENAAERFFRESRVERIWEGTSEIQRLIIAGSLYKRGAARLTSRPGGGDGEGLRPRARAFTQGELIPLEVGVEMSDGRLAPELESRIKQKMIEIHLNGMSLPREFGGQGYSYVEQVVIQEELGKATNGLWDIAYSPAVCLTAATPEQVERYVKPTCAGTRRDAYAITEPGAGSDPSRMATTAARRGADWVINGDKWHVTSGDAADYFVVQAETGAGVALFFVDKSAPGVEIYDAPRYMHTFIYEHYKIRFNNVVVPDANRLGEVGGGLDLTKEWFRRERLMIAARCVGAATRLIEETSAFAQSRVQFGSPIAEYQLIQAMLADSVTEMWAARLAAYAAAETEDALKAGLDPKIAHTRAAVAKLLASEMANRVADRCVQIFGGRGYMRENAAERFFRELRVDRIWEGTSEIQRLIIANSLYKRGVEALIN